MSLCLFFSSNGARSRNCFLNAQCTAVTPARPFIDAGDQNQPDACVGRQGCSYVARDDVLLRVVKPTTPVPPSTAVPVLYYWLIRPFFPCICSCNLPPKRCSRIFSNCQLVPGRIFFCRLVCHHGSAFRRCHFLLHFNEMETLLCYEALRERVHRRDETRFGVPSRGGCTQRPAVDSFTNHIQQMCEPNLLL